MDMCAICHRCPAVTRVDWVQNGQRRQMQLCEQHHRRLMQLQARPPFPLNAVIWSSARLAAFGRALMPLIAGGGLHSPETFSQASLDSLRQAMQLARDGARTVAGSEHLLRALCDSARVQRLLEQCGLSTERLKGVLQRRLASLDDKPGADEPGMSLHLGLALRQAQALSRELGQPRVGPEHLLLGLLSQTECGAEYTLRQQGLDLQTLRQALRRMPDSATLAHPRLDPTPCLDRYSRDLSELARQGRLDPLIGRRRELQATLEILARRKKNNPLLIGEPGVGKTALVEGLAQRLLGDGVAPALGGKRLVQLDLQALMAGIHSREECEARLQPLLEELVAHQDRLILFVDPLQRIIGTDQVAAGDLDLAPLFAPVLLHSELQLIGASTLEAYPYRIEQDAALARRFQPVRVREPSMAQTIAILRGLRQRLEVHHRVRIRDAALIAAAGLAARYIGQRFLPDKAIDLVDRAAARVRLAGSQRQEAPQGRRLGLPLPLDDQGEPRARVLEVQETSPSAYAPAARPEVVRVRDIAETLSALTGVALSAVSLPTNTGLLQLEQRLHRQVIGQNATIQALSDAVRLSRSGLRKGREPIASLLFLGPLGVGTSELAKALAEVLFGNGHAVIRLDMRHYREAHSLSRLIGAAPDACGHAEGGQLTERLRRRPYSLILLDQLDQAHPAVIQQLLQVFDQGWLTDGQGRRVDFSRCVMIATSNLGPAAGTSPRHDAALRAERLLALREHFPAAFLNRLDQIIVFETLSRTQVEAVVRLHLARLVRRVKAQGVVLSLDDRLVGHLTEQTCQPACGPRELKRLIRQELEVRLAQALRQGEVKQGEHLQLCFDPVAGIGLRKM